MQALGGCNADPNSWDVQGDLLAYGCGQSVIIQNINTFETVGYLPLKYGVVTVVKFSSNSYLFVGTCEGALMLVDPRSSDVLVTKTFGSSITYLSVSKNYIFFSLAFHGLKLMKYDNNSNIEEMIVKFPKVKCVCLSVFEFGEELFVAYGNPDGSISINLPLVGSNVSLDGNSWARCLSFCPGNGHLLFAASSQDRNIRIWKIHEHDSSHLNDLGVSVSSHSVLKASTNELNVELISILSGHSDWVNGIGFYGPEHLCSASFDGQVLKWTSIGNEDYDISFRLGTTAVGDDQSGFIGCMLVQPHDIIALSRNGGFSRWINGKAVQFFSGHNSYVVGATWSTEGFFITVGLDKVARAWAKVGKYFTEVARPMIHGHSVHDVVQLSIDRYAFTSDEKQIRILQPTSNFAKIVGGKLSSMPLPFASMVPPLTLSNKILMTADDVAKEFEPLTGADFVFDNVPPAHSMWLTRWPEIGDYWGHERELTKLAFSSQWLASGDDRGGVLIRDGNEKRFYTTYLKKDEIIKSPITALAAAPDSTSLIAVCKNGYVRLIESTNGFYMAQINTGENSMAASWESNSEYFYIGGESGLYAYERDGTICNQMKDLYITAIESIGDYQILVGTNSGMIQLIRYDPSSKEFVVVKSYIGHSDQVTVIKISPSKDTFISCSIDHSIILQNLK